ncbi:hypothetical protein C8Q78DRAFT_1057139 [Trametes maxima]|nr:hypothetical protein C8Q78DRAFT_1057139 [Trametes maxima]
MATKQGDGIEQINAEMIGVWFEILATGAYLASVPQCTATLRRSHMQGAALWLPLSYFLMFLCVVMGTGIAVARAYGAYAIHGNQPPNPVSTYSDTSSPLVLIKNSLNVVVAMIFDVIMIYRTFILWSMNIWSIVVPTGLFIGGVAVGIWALWTLKETRYGVADIDAAVATRIREFFIITFALNLLCFGMMCYQIWRVQSELPDDCDGPCSVTRRVLEVLIESAGLYCAHLLALIVTDALSSNYFFVFLDPFPPVGASVFTMLILRGRRAEQYRDSRTSIASTIRFQRPPLSPAEVAINLERIGDAESSTGEGQGNKSARRDHDGT